MMGKRYSEGYFCFAKKTGDLLTTCTVSSASTRQESFPLSPWEQGRPYPRALERQVERADDFLCLTLADNVERTFSVEF